LATLHEVAGVLPSSIAPGSYSVTVTYQSQASPPQSVTVVARSLGIATSNSAVSGAAQATIGNVNNGISLVRNDRRQRVIQRLQLDSLAGSSGDQTAAGNFTIRNVLFG
jgi:uncharacterized protein (TIGR03437 family)